MTNLLIMIMIGILLSVFGVNHYVSQSGLNITALLIYCSILGFSGSIVSLLLSKQMAKWTMGVHIIKQPANEKQKWLLDLIYTYSQNFGMRMPEFGVFEGPANAFATGYSKNNALVAVSTGLLNNMNEEEIAAVINHELAHVANGDMVTLTLVQGMVNTFTLFLSRLISYGIDRVILKNERNGLSYYILTLVFDILFGILGSLVVMWYSRKREYEADAGSAVIMGTPQPMINALKRLQAISSESTLTPSMQAMGICNSRKWMGLFSTHPSLQSRINALESLKKVY